MNVIDYILEGCKVTEKLKGAFIIYGDGRRATHTCAEGAAWIGKYGERADYPTQNDIDDTFPELDVQKETECPVCSDYRAVVSDMIIHLNDDHDWPREDIVAWLAVELGLATAVELPVQTEVAA